MTRVCVHILDKAPTTMGEALRIALNLEVSDCSQDEEEKVMAKH